MLSRSSLQRDAQPLHLRDKTNIIDIVEDYALWLSTSHQYDAFSDYHKNSRYYIDDASQMIKVRDGHVQTFAPFHRQYSALQTITPGQLFLVCLLGIGLILGALRNSTLLLTAIILLVSILYFGDLLFLFLLSARTLNQSTAEHIDDAIVHALAQADWPRYTILCPLYREAEIVPQFVQAMQSLDYPTSKLQILFLTEEEDTETRTRINTMNLPSHFDIITVPEGKLRTKPRACNFGLLQATGNYVVIYDAEDIPDPLQLKKAVLTFANHKPDVVCVQAKLNFYNSHQNIFTRLFTAEYSLWFDLVLPGLQSMGLPLPLGGTSNHFFTATLRALGAWDAFNVTEDCDLGLRLAHYQLKTVMLDSTTYEEANSQLKNWLRQRSRWIKGYMQTYLVNMRQPLRYFHFKYWSQFLVLQFVIGGKIITPFVNPLMWILLGIYVIYHTELGSFYQNLFPTLTLYISTLCLIFGNFLYFYSHITGCLKRGQYSIIKWTLLLPFYWILMSIAAFIAFVQLIFKPYYWEKTKHGLHLHHLHITSNAMIKTRRMKAIEEQAEIIFNDKEYLSASLDRTPYEVLHTMPLGQEEENIDHLQTMKLRTLSDVTTTSISSGQNGVYSQSGSVKALFWHTFFSDHWLLVVCGLACIASLAAFYYFFSTAQILTSRDAYAHLLIARRIFDNATPGIAQLGGVWLPLPHLLMLPFIWNDYLWHSGLAGSFVAMPCYVIAAIYLFLTARQITKGNLSSFVGTLLFILNPNVLYLQVLPSSEMVFIATMMGACYYFLAWAQDSNPKHLILAAFTTCLATISRYDGWFLFIAFLIGIAIIGFMKRQHRSYIEGNLLAFSALGGLGIVLWLAWCYIIFGDPLYFQHGPFSAQSDQASLISEHILYTYHNLWQSIRFIMLAFISCAGFVPFIFAILAFVLFYVRRRISVEMVASLIFFVPLLFYISSLYLGQATLLLPVAVPPDAPEFLHTSYGLYNLRFGVEVIAPTAFLLSILSQHLSCATQFFLQRLSSSRQRNFTNQTLLQRTFQLLIPLPIRSIFVPCILCITVIGQTALLATNGIILAQEGTFGLNCAPPNAVAAYFAQHYDGGKILEDLYTSREPGVDFKNVIYEGSGILWTQALRNPASIVHWVILNPLDKDDLVAEHINMGNGPFLSQFSVVLHDPSGIFLFHRSDLPPTPIQVFSTTLLREHAQCRISAPRHIRPLKKLDSTDFQAGIVFPRWNTTAYGRDDVVWTKGIQEITTQTSARWIEMPLLFTQDSLTSTTVKTGEATPTLTAFAEGIHIAHAYHYHIFVTPLLMVKGQRWSGQINFSTNQQAQQWFESYWQTIEPYVKLSAREQVEQLAIGTEYEWLEQHASNSLWNTLIDHIYSNFAGTITYDMNWSTLSSSPHAAWMHNIHLNMIGISTYIPLTQKREHLDLQQIATLWKSKVKTQIDAFSEEIGKPVLLSEIGFRNSTDAFYHTWEPGTSAPEDPVGQSYACEVVLANIVHDSHIRGAFFWGWDNVGLFRLRGLPASVVIHSWYTALNFT